MSLFLQKTFNISSRISTEECTHFGLDSKKDQKWNSFIRIQMQQFHSSLLYVNHIITCRPRHLGIRKKGHWTVQVQTSHQKRYSHWLNHTINSSYRYKYCYGRRRSCIIQCIIGSPRVWGQCVNIKRPPRLKSMLDTLALENEEPRASVCFSSLEDPPQTRARASIRPRCCTRRCCLPSEPRPARTCAVAECVEQWGSSPGRSPPDTHTHANIALIQVEL